MHMPCTAVMTGFQHFCHLGLSSSPGSTWFHTSSGWPNALLVSSPVLKARSPLAWSTTACTAGSSLTRPHTASTSSHMVRSKALSTSGRSSVMVATLSSPTS